MALHPSTRGERKPKLSERVVSALRQQVLTGAVEPGGKLPTELRLTETFGVSRTVVREAIARLAADGLVEPRQGAGVFVVRQPASTLGGRSSELSNKVSIALNVLEVRIPVEVEAAGLAALRRNASQEAEIQEAFFEFEGLLGLGEPTGSADFAFHRAISRATNNPFYREVLDQLGSRTIPCDVTSPWAADREVSYVYQFGLQKEHLVILNAISAGDSGMAREAMRQHLTASQLRYSARLRNQQAGYRPTLRTAPPLEFSLPF